MPRPTSIPDLKAWLRSTGVVIESRSLRGGATGTFEGFVLEDGRPYFSTPLTKDEREIVAAAIKGCRYVTKKFKAQQCFTNSQAILAWDESGKLIYVEGFAWTHSLHPVLHGWLSINDKVIDVTLPPTNLREAKLREPLRVMGAFEGRSYIGVPFLRSYVKRRMRATGWGSLLDDVEHEYPLLRQGGKGAVRRRG